MCISFFLLLIVVGLTSCEETDVKSDWDNSENHCDISGEVIDFKFSGSLFEENESFLFPCKLELISKSGGKVKTVRCTPDGKTSIECATTKDKFIGGGQFDGQLTFADGSSSEFFDLIVNLEGCLPESDMCFRSLFYPCFVSTSIFGNLILIIVYCAILCFAIKKLSDGSEMLLAVNFLSPTIVGSVILPLAGALPDILFVYFAATMTKEHTGLGMASIVGSSVLLLTIPFGLGIYYGKCDLNKRGVQIDGKDTGFDLIDQGVTFNRDVPNFSVILFLTLFFYLLPSFLGYFFTFVVCIVTFVLFTLYQMFSFATKTPLPPSIDPYDEENADRWSILQEDLQEKEEEEGGEMIMKVTTKDGTPTTTEEQENTPIEEEDDDDVILTPKGERILEQKQQHDDEEFEEDSDYEDYFNWSWRKILLVSVGYMGGAIVVCYFLTYPVAAAMYNLSDQLLISPFYLPFFICPLTTNLFEIFASVMFSKKKRRENNSITFAQLYAAAITNNTLVLGIFLLTGWWNDRFYYYGWTSMFYMEVSVLFVVVVVMCLIGFISRWLKYTLRLWVFPLVLLLYPASVTLFWFLNLVFW